MKKVLIAVLSGVAWLSVGCGGVVEDSPDEANTPTVVAPEGTDLAVNLSALNVCGGTCPSGYHIKQYQYGAGCGSSGTCYNSVVCEANSTSFYTCGTCPSGYHADAYYCDNFCFVCAGGCWGASNKSHCVPN